MLVDIGLVLNKIYSYGSDEEQHSDEGDEEKHPDGGVEEQPPALDVDDETTVTKNTEDNAMNDDLEEVNDGDKKPAAISMVDVFDNDLTRCSITDTGNVAQSVLSFAQSTTVNTGNVAQSTSAFAQSNTQIAAALAKNVSEWDILSFSPQVRQTTVPSGIVHFLYIQPNVLIFIFTGGCTLQTTPRQEQLMKKIVKQRQY
jgi:hypothetical protein